MGDDLSSIGLRNIHAEQRTAVAIVIIVTNMKKYSCITSYTSYFKSLKRYIVMEAMYATEAIELTVVNFWFPVNECSNVTAMKLPLASSK